MLPKANEIVFVFAVMSGILLAFFL
jgi:hypothetical protein